MALAVVSGAALGAYGAPDKGIGELVEEKLVLMQGAATTPENRQRADDILAKWREISEIFSKDPEVFRSLFGSLPEEKLIDKTLIACDEMASAKELGINTEVVDKLLGEFPAFWKENVSAVIYCNRQMMMPTRYERIPQNAMAFTYASPTNGTARVVMYKENWSDAVLRDIFTHEAGGHANDWHSHKRSLPQRVEMLYEILGRYKESDHFKTWADEIGSNPLQEANANRASEISILSDKLREYWAEIVRFYFNDPAKLPEKDRKLVEKYMKQE